MTIRPPAIHRRDRPSPEPYLDLSMRGPGRLARPTAEQPCLPFTLKRDHHANADGDGLSRSRSPDGGGTCSGPSTSTSRSSTSTFQLDATSVRDAGSSPRRSTRAAH
jgi:hypothetical protein